MSEETNEVAKTIAKNGLIFVIGTIFTVICSYAYRLILARWLGPGEYGVVSLGLAIIGLVSNVISFGLYDGLFRYVSYYRTKNNPEKVKGTFLAVTKLVLPLSVLVGILVFFFSNKIASNLLHNPPLAPILQLLAITIPLMFLANSFLQVCRAYKKLQYEVISRNFIENITKIVFTILFLFLGFKTIGVIFAYIISLIIGTAVAGFFMQTKIADILSTKIKAEYSYKEIIKYSLPLSLVSIISPIEHWLDTIMVGFFMTNTDVGLYNAALPTAQMVKIIFPALTALTIPIAIELIINKKLDDFIKTYKIISRWIFIICLPIFLIIILFPKPILNLLFGSEYISASTSLVILAIGYFVYAIAGPARQTVNAIGKTNYTLINYIIATLISIFGTIILIPIIGIAGAAIATAVSFAMTNVLAIFEIRKCVKINPFSKSWIKPIVCAGLSLGIFYVAGKLILPITNVTLIMTGAGFFLVYGILLLAFKSLSSEDLLVLDSISPKLKITLEKFVGK